MKTVWLLMVDCYEESYVGQAHATEESAETAKLSACAWLNSRSEKSYEKWRDERPPFVDYAAGQVQGFSIQEMTVIGGAA